MYQNIYQYPSSVIYPFLKAPTQWLLLTLGGGAKNECLIPHLIGEFTLSYMLSEKQKRSSPHLVESGEL